MAGDAWGAAVRRTATLKRTRLRRVSRKESAFQRAYTALRRKILRRDGYKCQACDYIAWDRDPARLEVHHVTKRSRDKTRRLDEANLVTLCRLCHARTDYAFQFGRLVIGAEDDGRFTFRIVTKASKWSPDPAA